MVRRLSWRMREEGQMLAFVAQCPDCHGPASVVVSSEMLKPPLSDLPEVFCAKCRKRFRPREGRIEALPVSRRRH